MTGSETVLTKAKPGSPSLRATVPAWLVEQLGLEAGDKLLWRLEPAGGDFRVLVEPIKKS